ncbi:MAG: type II toxin-antitoxin system VapC family toxin [Candidatus Solibacter usitatus]|nr:type II toxin-antitoxin system VapC family toxin [Candidatus Solibacter usitatus]
MKGLREFLRRHHLVALDTSVFIYQLEANVRYLPLSDHIFSWLEQADSRAITSTITMTELLTQPYRDAGSQRVDEIYGLLSTYPNLAWIAPSLEISGMAGRIRAAHRLRTPDALQAATAIHAGATGMITNDAVLKRVDAFETLVLDDLL